MSHLSISCSLLCSGELELVEARARWGALVAQSDEEARVIGRRVKVPSSIGVLLQVVHTVLPHLQTLLPAGWEFDHGTGVVRGETSAAIHVSRHTSAVEVWAIGATGLESCMDQVPSSL